MEKKNEKERRNGSPPSQDGQRKNKEKTGNNTKAQMTDHGKDKGRSARRSGKAQSRKTEGPGKKKDGRLDKTKNTENTSLERRAQTVRVDKNRRRKGRKSSGDHLGNKMNTKGNSQCQRKTLSARPNKIERKRRLQNDDNYIIHRENITPTETRDTTKTDMQPTNNTASKTRQTTVTE